MKTLALYTRYSRSAFAVLACACAASAFLYGVFLLEAVGHTAGRAHAEHAITGLKSKLSDVESTYLAQTQALTPALAQSLGFVTPTSVATVYASDSSHVLTLNGR